MRMGFALFIGILIILFGLGIIINVVFHVNIPIFQILVGLFIIYIGLRIIFGNWYFPPARHWHSGDSRHHHHRMYRGLSSDTSEYKAVFGNTVVDLRNIELKEKITRVRVKAVFGEAEVIIDKNIPVRIIAETVIGGVQFPENVAGAFGSASYQSLNFDENKNYLLIEGKSVFGGIEIHY